MKTCLWPHAPKAARLVLLCLLAGCFPWGSRAVRYVPDETALQRTYDYSGEVLIVGAGAAGQPDALVPPSSRWLMGGTPDAPGRAAGGRPDHPPRHPWPEVEPRAGVTCCPCAWLALPSPRR